MRATIEQIKSDVCYNCTSEKKKHNLIQRYSFGCFKSCKFTMAGFAALCRKMIQCFNLINGTHETFPKLHSARESGRNGKRLHHMFLLCIVIFYKLQTTYLTLNRMKETNEFLLRLGATWIITLYFGCNWVVIWVKFHCFLGSRSKGCSIGL
jgi:hypothetical protein